MDESASAPAAPQQARCSGCGTTLSTWFEVDGGPACDDCKDKAVSARNASHLPGLLRGGALGFLAAALGAGAYYAIAEATGKEFGLASILLGLLVGFAVRIGSGARGGWRYQVLAMFLCYASICATYVPRVISAARKQEEKAAAPSAAPPSGSVRIGAATPVAEAPARPPSPGRFFKALGMLFLFSLALPFLGGIDNLMGIAIILFGLYEAWKVNAGRPFEVTGPFMAGEARS